MSWRPATRADLPLAGLWTLAAGAAVASAPLLPTLALLASPCPLRTLTGIPCLTCGSTRAAIGLSHGELGGALAANPLAAVAILGGLAGGVLAPLWVWLGWPLPSVPRGIGARVALGAVLAGNWVWLVANHV